MTPRERVLLAVEHKATDRTPSDYQAVWPVTAALIDKLGVADLEELLRTLGVDMRRVGFVYEQPQTGPDADGYMRDMWGARRLRRDPDGPAAGDDRPEWVPPFDDETTVEDVHAHPWPDPAALDCSGVRAQCEAHRGTYATYGAPWSPFFHEVGWLVGQEQMFVWMSTKPEVVQAIINHVVDYEVEATRRFLDAAGGMLDVAYFGNDFGTQRGLFISPAMWERFIRAPLRRFYDVAHERGCKVMQHSCGAVRGIVPWLIEDGVDVLDPVQTAAAGMDLAGLVRDFGGRLAFHGGVDTQGTLPFGTTAEVRAEVRSYIELTRERGGYILCGSQEYIEDIPLENILAVYDENAKGRPDA